MEGEDETPSVVENAWAYKVIAFYPMAGSV